MSAPYTEVNMRYTTDNPSYVSGAHEGIVYPRNIKLENIAYIKTVEAIKLFAFFRKQNISSSAHL